MKVVAGEEIEKHACYNTFFHGPTNKVRNKETNGSMHGRNIRSG